MDPSSGLERVGEYDLLGELGRGGMGCVYRARHRPTGAIRALKLVSGSFDPEAVARFHREAEALARVGGEGVVAIHEAGSDKGRPFLVMALMAGGSLRDRLRADGRLPWREAAGLVVVLARALGRCHAAGLVHRDLKPENILFDDERRPFLADFGATRDLNGSRLTETGTVIGTPSYMAPEQLDGKRVEAPADIYALGVVLHEAVTGSLPYPATPSLYKLLAAKVAAQRKPVSDEVPGVPPGLDAVIARALAPGPEARQRDAGALAAELEAVLAGTGAVAASRRPIWLVAVGMVALAVGVAWLERRPTAKPGPDLPVPAAPPPVPPRGPEVVPDATPEIEKLLDRVASGTTAWEEAEPRARTLAASLTGERRRDIAARWAGRILGGADARPRALCRFVGVLDRATLPPATVAEALRRARDRVEALLPAHLLPGRSVPDPEAELAFLDAAMFVAEEPRGDPGGHDPRLAGGLLNTIAGLVELKARPALAQARAALDDAERLDPGRAETHHVRGCVLVAEMRAGMSRNEFLESDGPKLLREAVEEFRSARKTVDPAFDAGHRGWAGVSLANAYQQLHEHAAALEVLDAVERAESLEERAVHDDPIAVISHARAAFEFNQDDRAAKLLEAGAAKRPAVSARFLALAAAVRNVSPATREEVHDKLWQLQQ